MEGGLRGKMKLMSPREERLGGEQLLATMEDMAGRMDGGAKYMGSSFDHDGIWMLDS